MEGQGTSTALTAGTVAIIIVLNACCGMYVQVLVFWNLYTFAAHADDLIGIVLSLMNDPQIEV